MNQKKELNDDWNNEDLNTSCAYILDNYKTQAPYSSLCQKMFPCKPSHFYFHISINKKEKTHKLKKTKNQKKKKKKKKKNKKKNPS